MNVTDYQIAIRQFVRYHKDDEMSYLFLGLILELRELSDKYNKRSSTEERIYEIGDVCWFASMLVSALDKQVVFRRVQRGSDTRIIPKVISDSFGLSCDIGDIWNKTLRKSRGQLGIEERSVVLSTLEMIFQNMETLAIREGTTLEFALDENVNKLSDRQVRGTIVGTGDTR